MSEATRRRRNSQGQPKPKSRPAGALGHRLERSASTFPAKLLTSLTPERIAAFETDNVRVDAYGVGSFLLSGSYDYTADIVQVDGKPMAKVGRGYRPDPRLQPVLWNELNKA